MPLQLGPGEESGLVRARRRLSSFQIGYPAAAGPQDEAGRSRAACAVSHRGRSRRLAGMRPGQSPGRGWAAGRRGHCGLERLPVTKQDPPCGSLPDPQRLAALLKGSGGHAPLDTAGVPSTRPSRQTCLLKSKGCAGASEGDGGENSPTKQSRRCRRGGWGKIP